MKFSSSFLISSCFIGMLISGCGTITNGTKQKVAISTSTGHQVIARIDGKKVQIPSNVDIGRKTGANIQVLNEDNPCFEDTNYSVAGKGKVSGVFWINIISGGTFGSTTDAISGGMWEYSNPNFVIPVTKKPNCTPKPLPKIESDDQNKNETPKDEKDSKSKQDEKKDEVLKNEKEDQKVKKK